MKVGDLILDQFGNTGIVVEINEAIQTALCRFLQPKWNCGGWYNWEHLEVISDTSSK